MSRVIVRLDPSSEARQVLSSWKGPSERKGQRPEYLVMWTLCNESAGGFLLMLLETPRVQSFPRGPPGRKVSTVQLFLVSTPGGKAAGVVYMPKEGSGT